MVRERARRHVRQCVVCGRKFMGYKNSMMCSDRCRGVRSLTLRRATKDELVISARKAVSALAEEQREGLRIMLGKALGRFDGSCAS